ncbi:hypothetical protein CGI68_10390 [Vibrio parahaemolyticus]|nr:hypothetical protein CGI68_10390 [Vibrio parahaemolyticus]
MHSSEIIERVKQFFQFIFSEAFYLSDPAEALSRLPCRWMRIIGSSLRNTSLFFKKTLLFSSFV